MSAKKVEPGLTFSTDVSCPYVFFFSRFVYTRTFTRVKACKITRQWESTFIDFHLTVVVIKILLQKKL